MALVRVCLLTWVQYVHSGTCKSIVCVCVYLSVCLMCYWPGLLTHPWPGHTESLLRWHGVEEKQVAELQLYNGINTHTHTHDSDRLSHVPNHSNSTPLKPASVHP